MLHWSQSKIQAFQKTLLDWYDAEKRDLPWRRDHDPYHVLVSEIMLQQTQVQTVIPYYERFMTLFPTVSDLAKAPVDTLMKAWEGLGYYSRARNLQRAARQIVDDYHGQWPQTAQELQTLAGVGPYTAGAVASIAFGEVVPAVDGNAFRVFSRLLKIDADIAKPQTRKIYEDAIQAIMPTDRPGDFNQAIMDLGSSYMTAKNPDSTNSPVKAFNQAYLDGVEDQYPVKTKKPRPTKVEMIAVVVVNEGKVLLERRPSSGLLANFWTFPLVAVQDLEQQVDTSGPLVDDQLLTTLTSWFKSQNQLTLSAVGFTGGKVVKHTFTHRQWLIRLVQADVDTNADLSFFPGQWFDTTQIRELTLPKVQDKLFQQAVDLGLLQR